MNESVDVSTPVRAIIADDHPLVLLAVENLMTGFANMHIVGRASDSTELFAEADRVECDLAVVDLYMPGSVDADAIGMLRQFRKRYPKVALVVLTMETSPEALERLISLGVDAVMSKRDRIDLIHVAIVTALARERYVGPAVRAASGIAVTEIASRLGRSVKTISAQKCKAMRKLALHSDSELFKFAAEYGLLPDDMPKHRR
jgi:two-component system capsular synthesis response regulator RcsB